MLPVSWFSDYLQRPQLAQLAQLAGDGAAQAVLGQQQRLQLAEIAKERADGSGQAIMPSLERNDMAGRGAASVQPTPYHVHGVVVWSQPVWVTHDSPPTLA